MIANFNLSQLFSFPVKDDESRKNFLIAALVYLAAFIIPILPIIVIMGYTARIMRQAINGESPHMPAWDDWESMFKDGLYLMGVRLVYALPVFILLIPLFLGTFFIPMFAEASHGSSDQFLLAFPLFFALFFLILFPFSLALGIILPAAESHVVANGDFAAGFRIREWWPIFRANWAGFVIAYLIAMVASFALTLIIQFAMITIILICILPFIMPAITAYLTLIMYTAFAQAYKDGKDHLSQQPIANSQ
jgi:hypothetical protein